MIAIDTNIIVRFLTKDDAKQYDASKKLFETEKIYIPDTVILEDDKFVKKSKDLSTCMVEKP